MSDNTDLLAVGISGAMSVGAKGAARPTNLAASINPATWYDVGWISSDGLKNAVKETQKEFTPWGSATPARTVTTASAETFDVTMWETNGRTLEVYYRKPFNSLTEGVDGSYDVDTGPVSNEHFAALFDIVDGNNHIRLWCPDVQTTGKGDVIYAPGDIIGYPVTLTAYPDETGIAVYRQILVGAIGES